MKQTNHALLLVRSDLVLQEAGDACFRAAARCFLLLLTLGGRFATRQIIQLRSQRR